MADKAPIAVCLSFLWFETGYRACLLRDPVASAFEEHFELVHTLAVQADARSESLSAFVAELEGYIGKPDKLEIELPRESSRGVRIMTVHKSKGLEFPVVIIPQANNVGRNLGAGDSWYWEEKLGPTFKPPAAVGSRSRNAFFEGAREHRAAMEGAELKRLLYVALTRAESHIVVTSTAPYREDAAGRSFRSLLAPALGLFEEPSPLAAAKGRADSKATAGTFSLPPFGLLASLPSGALVGLIPERSDHEYFALVRGAKRRGASAGDFSAAAIATIPLVDRRAWQLSASVSSFSARFEKSTPPLGENLEIRSELAAPEGLDADIWGTLVHAVLESRLKPRAGGLRLSPGLETALESALDGKAQKEAMQRASRLAEVFLDSELGRRALAAKERYVELKIAIGLRVENSTSAETPRCAARRARGSIDLAFVEGDKVVVVDYKTDASITAGAHDFQVAAYKGAGAKIFGLRAEAWVFYLYGGGRAVLVDEDGSAPRLEDAPDPEPNSARCFGDYLDIQ
jgi:ATP-dependent helicase/nuclease subunit A